jgi:hypothetical protein
MEVIDVARMARVLLNDTEEQVYKTDVLLPFIQLAYGEAEKHLSVNGIGAAKEVISTIPITAGMKAITVNEINDMVLPIAVSERTPGETTFSDMYMKRWEPGVEPDIILHYWTWRGNEIKLIGATQDREVRVKYLKGFPLLVNENSPIRILGALEFLAYRSAGLASRYIGGNNSRAEALDLDSARVLPIMIANEIKNTQSMPVRRRPFRTGHR